MIDRAPPGAALVTGAGRRIGRRIALDLADAGYAVGVHCLRSRAEAEEVVREINGGGGAAALLVGDLARRGVPEELVEQARGQLGPLTCLVNNASIFERDAVGVLGYDSWDAHLDTNLRAPVFLSQAFARQLPEDAQGNIVNMIDQRVLRPNPDFFSYTVSKAALWSVTRTLAQALAPRIRVNAVAPGPALPHAGMDAATFRRLETLLPLQRGTRPEEISAAVRFILAAPAMTGQMIALDGGQHLAWRTPDVTDIVS